MSLFAKGNAGSRFYVDMEHGDVFEEGADGVRQVAGDRLLALDELQQASQQEVP